MLTVAQGVLSMGPIPPLILRVADERFYLFDSDAVWLVSATGFLPMLLTAPFLLGAAIGLTRFDSEAKGTRRTLAIGSLLVFALAMFAVLGLVGLNTRSAGSASTFAHYVSHLHFTALTSMSLTLSIICADALRRLIGGAHTQTVRFCVGALASLVLLQLVDLGLLVIGIPMLSPIFESGPLGVFADAFWTFDSLFVLARGIAAPLLHLPLCLAAIVLAKQLHAAPSPA